MAPRLVTNAGMPDNFGRLPAVELAGASMLAIVQAIPELESRTGRKPTVIGGLAVLSRLGTAYRATSDLDTVSRRATGDPPQVDVLLAAGARRAGPAGVWIQTSAGMVQVDIIEVTDAELSQLPDDETDRLAVLSHAWAIETATRMRVRVASQSEVPDTEVIVRVAEPGPLIAMKLQSIMNRPAAKERTDLLDVVRLTLDSTVGPLLAATLFAHELAAVGGHATAGLGGDGCRFVLERGSAAGEATLGCGSPVSGGPQGGGPVRVRAGVTCCWLARLADVVLARRGGWRARRWFRAAAR